MSTIETAPQPSAEKVIVEWRSLYYTETNFAIGLIVILAFVLACTAIALHVPGQISMDTSIQLYEASTGQATSFNPPFMSALMRWVGGGEIATSTIVLINAICLYGGLALVAITTIKIKANQESSKIATWRVLITCLVIANPIIFIYTGIIWKDVLFASLLTCGCAFGVAANFGSSFRRTLSILLSIFLLACSYLTRQQGIFMAPVLLLVPIASIYYFKPSNKIFSTLAIVVLFIGTIFFLEALTKSSINSLDGKFESAGYNSIMKYDLAGIVSNSDMPNKFFVYPISNEQLTAVRSVYDPSRIDYLERSKIASDWLDQNGELRHTWLQMIKQNPSAYLQHRTNAYAALLGLHGIAGTLPIHVGIEGNSTYLASVGMSLGTNKRSQLLYQIATSFYQWPIYKHIFWMITLIVIATVGTISAIPKPLKLIGLSIAASSALMYASFFPTTIASDFRYLFATIPLIMSLTLIVTLGASRKKSAATT
ncbi:hypothetical protein [Pseudomonas fluorescens]|uniref:Glycosyltransferase RgtA/B/C/D-like domain-containing protein n=1 Tax=Pseudomonas fluorescens TaxID=294 RepID=A0A5E7RMN9_PSEFL|nr:hypothetical protein [Pseudomonas fluorescens]VVP74748.1 hypothetical protein PS928_00145 [Pseudomonas fluorescens]